MFQHRTNELISRTTFRIDRSLVVLLRGSNIHSRRSTAARLLRLWVRIPPGAWMFVCCECCVLSGRGLCDALITRPDESYRLWCVVVCDLEISRMSRPWPSLGRSATGNKQTYTVSVLAAFLPDFCEYQICCLSRTVPTHGNLSTH